MKVSIWTRRRFRHCFLAFATILLGLPCVPTTTAANDLEALRRIESDVQRVARQNMNVVVHEDPGINGTSTL